MGWEEGPRGKKYIYTHGFPGDSDGKASSCNVEDLGSIPGLGRSPGEGKGYLLQYSSLEFHGLHSPWGRKELDTTERLSLSLFHKLASSEAKS